MATQDDEQSLFSYRFVVDRSWSIFLLFLGLLCFLGCRIYDSPLTNKTTVSI